MISDCVCRAGESTNVMITACNNCKIITAPNTGILSMDRCENVQVTAISSLIRVRCVTQQTCSRLQPMLSVWHSDADLPGISV